jgi:hypothetical protein
MCIVAMDATLRIMSKVKHTCDFYCCCFCRYAITLWYFDKDEREAEYQRLLKMKQEVCDFFNIITE